MGTVEQDLIEGRRRRVNPILVVILILLALVALWFLVISPLISPGEPEPAPPSAVPGPSPEEPPATPAAPPEETFEVFEAKDPFRPLVVVGAAPAGTTPAGTTETTTSAGAAGAPAPSGGQRVTLLDIFEEGGQTKAQVRVNGTVYKVAPGEVFADNFKLVSISGQCASFLHGDVRFTLCVGEEVIK